MVISCTFRRLARIINQVETNDRQDQSLLHLPGTVGVSPTPVRIANVIHQNSRPTLSPIVFNQSAVSAHCRRRSKSNVSVPFFRPGDIEQKHHLPFFLSHLKPPEIAGRPMVSRVSSRLASVHDLEFNRTLGSTLPHLADFHQIVFPRALGLSATQNDNKT